MITNPGDLPIDVLIYSPVTMDDRLMDAKAIRRLNWRALIERYGSQRAHGAAMGMSKSQVSQLASSVAMGDAVARRAETVLGLPYGWMDQLHVTEDDGSLLVQVVQRLQSLPLDDLRKVMAILEAFAPHAADREPPGHEPTR